MSGVMESVGGALFGSSEDARQTGTASTLTPGQSGYLNQILNLLSGQIGQGVTPYSGQITAGEQPLQTLSFDMINKLLTGQTGLNVSPEYQAGSSTLQNILNTGLKTDITTDPAYQKGLGSLDSILADFDPSSATEMWKSTYVNPALDTWKKEIAPAINEKYIARNAQYSSAMPKALAKSGEELMTNLSGHLANILYSGEQAQKDRQASGATTALNYAGLPASLSEAAAGRQASGTGTALNYGNTLLNSILSTINAGLAGGTTQQGISQGELSDAFTKWQQAQGYNNPWLNLSNLALGTTAFQPIVQGPTQTPGLLTSLLGGAGQGAGQVGGAALMAALLGSAGDDRRPPSLGELPPEVVKALKDVHLE